jgi:hypothetical protein
MKFKTFTLHYLFLFLSLLAMSRSYAQRAAPPKLTAQNAAIEYFKNKLRSPATLNKPTGTIAGLNAAMGRRHTPGDTAMRWFQKKDIVAKKRHRVSKPRLSGARTSATADGPLILYVNYKAAGSNDGTSWTDAFSELADALFYARDKTGIEQIWVANGYYYPLYDHNYRSEGDDYDLRDNVFIMLPNIKMYGGFKGTETSLAERDLRYNPIDPDDEDEDYETVLSGDVFDPEEEGSNANNAYHVVLSAGPVGTATLDGFSIEDGYADGEFPITLNGVNIPRNFGGGMMVVNSSPSLSNVNFLYNIGASGSALYGNLSNLVLTNAVFANNYANNSGTLFIDESSPVITNVTFSRNTAQDNGGGITLSGAGTAAQIRNTIIYGNEANDAPAIFIEAGATASFAYSIIEGSGGSTAWNPAFGTDDGNNLDKEVFFQPFLPSLMAKSPGVNAGSNQYFQAGQTPDLSAITTDQRGLSRFIGGTTDIGALESLFGPLSSDLSPSADSILFVKKNGLGTMTGDSWANAAAEVADALYAAAINPAVKQIWVAGGKYAPLYRPDDLSKVPNGRYDTFLMVEGVSLYGGFAGNEVKLDERDLSLSVNASILSGDLAGDDTFNFEEFAADRDFDLKYDDNAYRVVTMAPTRYYVATTINGFTIEGGNNREENPRNPISVSETNLAIEYGSGVYAEDAYFQMENVVVRRNFGLIGGGLAIRAAAVDILNSLFYHNIDAGTGSSIASVGSFQTSLLSFNSTVARNLSLTNGPAVGLNRVDAFMINNIIYGNIVSDNSVDENGDDPKPDLKAVRSSGVIASSIIGGSGGSHNWKLFADSDENEIFDGGFNLDEDPGFTSSSTSDFSLIPCSPAIDAGLNIYAQVGIINIKDVAGNPRVANDSIDIGALEFQDVRPLSATELAGNGKASSFVFEDGQPHTFTVNGQECESDLLTLKPEVLSGEVTAKVWVDAQVNSYGGAFYLQRHFDIAPAEHADESLGRAFLYFTQAEFDALNSKLTESAYLPTGDPETDEDRKANLRIYQFHGPSSDGSGNPGSYTGSRVVIDPEDMDIVWNGGMKRWEVAFNVDGFSGFFGGTATQNPLPVRLVSFEGKRSDDQTTNLQWKVAEQENIEVYQVEYSRNGKTFNQIGQVTANTLESTDYNFADSLSHSGDRAYYRLKVIEFDGKTAFSKIVTVKLTGNDVMIAYPVPAKNELWIDWKKTNAASVDFIDSKGRVLKTIKKTSASQKVDISSLPAGLLLLKAGEDHVLKVVKE